MESSLLNRPHAREMASDITDIVDGFIRKMGSQVLLGATMSLEEKIFHYLVEVKMK